MPAPILLVTPLDPSRTDSGGVQRTHLWLESLRTLGEVDVLHLAPDAGTHVRGNYFALPVGPSRLPWKRYAPDAGLTRRVEALMARPLASYRLIVGRYALPLSMLALPAGVPTVVDLDDHCYRHGRPWTEEPGSLPQRLRKALGHWLERRAVAAHDHAFVANVADVPLVAARACSLLPNVALDWANAEAPAPPPRAEPTLLFVGALWYQPNRDGVEWFLGKVWPAVRRAVPQARLTLAGAASPRQRRAWERQPGVSAPGFVPDLREAYANASAVVVPIHAGGGSNIKVLEALAHARPCIVSTFAAAGFGAALRDGAHLLKADNARAFADRTVAVLRKPPAYAAMAAAGAAQVRRHFSPAAFTARVSRTLAPLLRP